MRVKFLDDPIVLAQRTLHADGSTDSDVAETVWYKNTVQKEEAIWLNEQSDKMIEAVKGMTGQEAMMMIQAISQGQKIKETEGEPWTFRQAAIFSLYSKIYQNVKRDKQGQIALEEPEVVAMMHQIGRAFVNAPIRGYVDLDAKQMELLRRKMYELPLPPYVAGEFSAHLDEVEGSTRKNEVAFGKEETDDRQDDAGKTGEVAKV